MLNNQQKALNGQFYILANWASGIPSYSGQHPCYALIAIKQALPLSVENYGEKHTFPLLFFLTAMMW